MNRDLASHRIHGNNASAKRDFRRMAWRIGNRVKNEKLTHFSLANRAANRANTLMSICELLDVDGPISETKKQKARHFGKRFGQLSKTLNDRADLQDKAGLKAIKCLLKACGEGSYKHGSGWSISILGLAKDLVKILIRTKVRIF